MMEGDPRSSMETKIFLADDSLLQEDEEFIVHVNDQDRNTGTLDLACSPLHILPPAFLNPIKVSHEPTEPCERDADTNSCEDNINASIAISSDPNQIKRRKKLGGYNLRKSLAWNSAFFTEQGVLNRQELSRLGGSQNNFKEEFLSATPEDGTHLLQDEIDSSGSGKLYHNSPLRPLMRDSKTSRDLVKAVNKCLSQGGGCPRPLASDSQKRLPSNSRNALTNDMKIPKLSALKLVSYVSAVPKTADFDAKRSSCKSSRPAGNLEKQPPTKGFSSASKNSFGCISSTARISGKDLASKATSGTKVIPGPLPTVDASSSKIGVPHLQSAQYGGRRFTNAQTFATKPSGLRPPSPSLRYFAQPQASTSLGGKSLGDAESCNHHEVSFPSLRPSHEPAGTNCLTSSAATTVKFNKEKKINVGGMLQASPLANSEDVCGADKMIEHEQGEKSRKFLVDIVSSEMTQSDEDVEINPIILCGVEHKENDDLSTARLVDKKSCRDSVKDNDVGNSENDQDSDLSNISNSGGQSKCELDNSLQGGPIQQLRNDGQHGNFIEFYSENEEKRGLEISSLVSPGGKKCSVSAGSEYLMGDMNRKQVEDSVGDIEDVSPRLHEEKEELKTPIIENGEDNKRSEQLEDNDSIRDIISSSGDTESSMDSGGGENKCDKENNELMEEDNGAMKQRTLPELRHDALTLKQKLNAAPFSDEWVAALEEVGEEILTMKTGAVQNSPPDKSGPELGPWSPVKRKNNTEIGPFDCTKYTSTTHINL